VRWEEHVAGIAEMRNAYKILVGRTEQTTRKTRRRWDYNIRIDLARDLPGLGWGPVAGCCEQGNE